jgi:hypothetical protein
MLVRDPHCADIHGVQHEHPDDRYRHGHKNAARVAPGRP